MNNTLKIAIHGLIGTFIYYIAFAKNVFIFEILAWTVLVMGFIGLMNRDIMKEVVDMIDWRTYIASIPFSVTSIFIMFNYGADVFGYLYILFIMISQSMILNYKLKN